MPAEERLFSLVLALLASDNGLTKSEILSTVQGYRQRYARSGDNANLERQFERDKDDIRELGVPLETLESPTDPGNNQNLRYRIPRGDYELPTDISFSPEETTLLNLAAMVWREGSLSGESRRAILKLRSLGVTSTEPVLGYAPRLRVRDAAFAPLSSALEKRVIVKFAYLKPGEKDARTRTVAPIALIQQQGRWMLHAEDQDAGGTRNFLLRRIVSPITATSKHFEPFPADAAQLALDELERIWHERTAVVEVEQGSDAATRLQKRPGTTVSDTDPTTLLLHYTDINLFADELAGFGPEALVRTPPELRDAVRSRLEVTAADHG
ncbi:helix-turn-helix transcriptional regulator [Glaciihabitans sp. dw_435]|uniref:helix-turn-helix transcriptional regulator n=1 Tax=Glaciihabitans sp. dw_435 TaxID=2720081 RepID=UPI0035AC2837